MGKLMIMTPAKFERLVQRRVEQELLKKNTDYEENLTLKQADMAYLQNQINPHFLYNTLECIRGQALNEGITDIADTVKALAQFFRYSISMKDNVVSLEDELNNLRNYISIQQYRFKNKFRLVIALEEAEKEQLLDCMIPKLSLQPIAENAIVHGFGDMTENGLLTVRGYLSEDNVVIAVSDNGSGMDSAVLKRLNDKINSKVSFGENGHTGIGLQNVQKRIQILFGYEYGLFISSVPGMGTTVEMFFPLRHRT